jgi:hypothetical protein
MLVSAGKVFQVVGSEDSQVTARAQQENVIECSPNATVVRTRVIPSERERIVHEKTGGNGEVQN